MNNTNHDILVAKGCHGARKLKGTIVVKGSKNDALQALAASLLFGSPLTLTNVPAIEDIARLGNLLTALGVAITEDKKLGKKSLTLDTSQLHSATLDDDIAKKLRASIILTGPLLARRGEAHFPHPGGCVIGERPIDLFLDGFAKLGASITIRNGRYHLTAPRDGLRGAEIFFRNQTVTGTECFMLTAVLTKGQTVLKNCALEPEIESLGKFLVREGARIRGLGTTTITIDGGPLLKSLRPSYEIIPDRIEAGSFLILGALLMRELTITRCEPGHLDAVIAFLRSAGATIKIEPRQIIIRATPRQSYRALPLTTHEYPGFPTDLQALMAVFLTQATGESRIFETIFEGRLGYLETLARMGAEVHIHNQHQATVGGPTLLTGREVTSPDLRAGLAYLIAGLVAKAETIIHNVHCIDRGYEKIDERLAMLGFNIKRHHSP
ncbi:MAG: UDP-N-acetylglucosamine 1-carboxyvinyltransferase [Patescibacteria group bacterium]